MKKGLLFIVVFSLLFWGYYYFVISGEPGNPDVANRDDQITFDSRITIHKASLGILETSIGIFHEREGRFPRDLSELVTAGYISEIPDDGGKTWEYDPVDGEIN